MLEYLNGAIKAYQINWNTLVNKRQDPGYFEALLPVAVGWKAADEASYQQQYALLRPLCDRIVETWMNGRWIAQMHLKDSVLAMNIQLIKLMQRRPDSSDAIGLDHIDFYGPEVVRAEQVLASETDLEWSLESNDVVANYDWISIWFDDTEAKLKSGTVIDIVVTELLAMKDNILQQKLD